MKRKAGMPKLEKDNFYLVLYIYLGPVKPGHKFPSAVVESPSPLSGNGSHRSGAFP